jgi:hypothetical protein
MVRVARRCLPPLLLRLRPALTRTRRPHAPALPLAAVSPEHRARTGGATTAGWSSRAAALARGVRLLLSRLRGQSRRAQLLLAALLAWLLLYLLLASAAVERFD